MAGNNYIKPISVKTFNCPNCASNVKVRVQGQSLTVVCMSCKSIIDTSDENLKILQKINDKKSRRQYIPFGARGVINDVIWEVIGYLEKKDVKYNFYWSEYLLFNPYKGYRWLAESDGHWNFFTTIKDKPFKKKSTQKYVVYDNKKFSIFNRGNIEVSYVMGEFYWKVRIGTISKASDYISPPYMLSSEELKSEIVWSKGVYVSPDEIKKTFNVEKVPSPYGVGPNQESPHIKNHTFVKKSYYLMLLLLFTFQSFFCFGSKGNVVYKSVFQFHGGDNDKPKKSGSFEVNADSKNMELKLASPVDNNWVEINIAMVNEKTGDTIEVIHGLEYYHGYSDGEKWTEGSQSTSKLLSSIPKGTYHIIISVHSPTLKEIKVKYNKDAEDVLNRIDPYSKSRDLLNKNKNMNKKLDVKVQLRSDVTNWQNFFLSLFFISIYPLITYWKKRRFESKRWSNSDFAP